MKIFSLALSVLAFPVVSQAQSIDHFENGPARWFWYSATSRSVGSPDPYQQCEPSKFERDVVDWTDTPNTGPTGRFAFLMHFNTGDTSFKTCRKISRRIVVPTGKRLYFAYKLGSALDENPTLPHTDAIVHLTTEVSYGGKTEILRRDIGQSKQCVDRFGEYRGCPPWIGATVNMRRYWGKTVTLTFVTSTAGGRNGWGELNIWPSDAMIDNIRFK